MVNVRENVLRILPHSLKVVLRSWYGRLSGRWRDRPSKIAIISLGGFEIAYRKNTADEAVIGHSFINNIYFSGVPEYKPEEGHVIIDIGAHIGTFSLLGSSRVGATGKVFAIEPSDESFNLLRINVALNRCTNISVHHFAVSDKEGHATLHHGAGNYGNSIVKKLSSSGETVQTCTLTTFFERNRIAECNFMKLNCEGAEFPILLSTPGKVLQRVSTVLVLYHCDLWSPNTEVDLQSHLESCGFHCVIRNRTEKRGWIIAQRIRQLVKGATD